VVIGKSKGVSRALWDLLRGPLVSVLLSWIRNEHNQSVGLHWAGGGDRTCGKGSFFAGLEKGRIEFVFYDDGPELFRGFVSGETENGKKNTVRGLTCGRLDYTMGFPGREKLRDTQLWGRVEGLLGPGKNTISGHPQKKPRWFLGRLG